MAKHGFEKMVPNGDGTVRWEFDADKAREKFQDATVDGDGIVRWNSNGSVPPQDILQDWVSLGLPFDLAQSERERDRQIAKVCADYRKMRARRGYSAEEMFEMRAAFGPDAEVVDVITGRKIRL